MKHPFTDSELITILEAARVALADGTTFDDIAVKMDIPDEEMSLLLTKLIDFLKEDHK